MCPLFGGSTVLAQGGTSKSGIKLKPPGAFPAHSFSALGNAFNLCECYVTRLELLAEGCPTLALNCIITELTRLEIQLLLGNMPLIPLVAHFVCFNCCTKLVCMSLQSNQPLQIWWLDCIWSRPSEPTGSTPASMKRLRGQLPKPGNNHSAS